MKRQNLEKQLLANKEKLKEVIQVCELKEKHGPTEAAKIINLERITANRRPTGATAVCQIYAAYQVFLASEIAQELFYSGVISWSAIYKSRKIYNRGSINRSRLNDLESELLDSGGKTRAYKNINEYYQVLEQQVNHSKRDSSSRKERLKTASKKPEILRITQTVFKRNPDVIAEVLERARGFCERCKKCAPFIRKSDGTPFLEVHHTIPLAEDGEDSVENTIALCPNCHREMHYGFLD